MTQTHTHCKTVEPQKFNTTLRNVLALLFALALAGSVALQFTFKPHPHFEYDAHYLFYPIFGLAMSMGLVIVSKILGFIIKRRETYWEEKP
ncbi:MAG: hypothetical protein MK052_01460 [Alphaproteobacteria bacterium]|nr:hypothetical protein [Alphaproteobacteria bacterium]